MSWLPSNTTPSFVLLVRVPCTSITAKGGFSCTRCSVLNRHPFTSPVFRNLLLVLGHHGLPSILVWFSSSFEQCTPPALALVEWPHPPPFQPPKVVRARGRGY